MTRETIDIPSIVLEWSEWTAWNDLLLDARQEGGISVPNDPGVYEVRRTQDTERLTIGKASNLRRRVKQGLVKGNLPHSTGKRIRGREDVSGIVIRWAVTDRPAAVEEALHKRHVKQFGRLPIYTKRT